MVAKRPAKVAKKEKSLIQQPMTKYEEAALAKALETIGSLGLWGLKMCLTSGASIFEVIEDMPTDTPVQRKALAKAAIAECTRLRKDANAAFKEQWKAANKGNK